VAQLETSLGAQLLLRSTRKLTLTEAGGAYFTACKRIVEDVRDAERGVAGEYSAPRGGMTITAPIVFGRWHVLPIVCDFLTRYPQINIRLVLTDRNVALIDDQIDIAIRVGTLPDSSLVATRVGTVKLVVCASPDLLKERGRPKTPSDLGTLPCVTLEALSGSAHWAFAPERGGRTHHVRVLERLSVNTAEAAVDAALAGVGLARVLSYQSAPAISRGKLEAVLKEFEPAPSPVHLIHSGGRPLALKFRTFLDFAAPRLRAVLRSEHPASNA
jgi:DNA-binding transcriptional LysR family regulator